MKHDDGTVTVHYEVPAGNNECFELSKRVTPLVRPVPWNRLGINLTERALAIPSQCSPWKLAGKRIRSGHGA